MASVKASKINYKTIVIAVCGLILVGLAIWYFFLRSKEYPGVPRTAVKYYKEGLDSLDAGRIEAAANLFTKAVDLDHTFADACAKLAETYYQAGAVHKRNKDIKMQNAMFDQSKRFMNMAFDANPLNGNAYFVRGLLHYENEEWSDATRDLELAIIYGVSNFNVHSTLAYLYNQSELTAKCVEQYQKALNYKKNDVRTLTNLGDIYFQLENYTVATDYYSSVLKENESNIKIKTRYAVALWKSGQQETAKNILNQILSDDAGKKVQNYNAIAWALVDNDVDYEWGLKLAQAADEMKPNNIESLNILGWTYFKLKDYDKAIQLLSKSYKQTQSEDVKERIRLIKEQQEKSSK